MPTASAVALFSTSAEFFSSRFGSAPLVPGPLAWISLYVPHLDTSSCHTPSYLWVVAARANSVTFLYI